MTKLRSLYKPSGSVAAHSVCARLDLTPPRPFCDTRRTVGLRTCVRSSSSAFVHVPPSRSSVPMPECRVRRASERRGELARFKSDGRGQGKGALASIGEQKQAVRDRQASGTEMSERNGKREDQGLARMSVPSERHVEPQAGRSLEICRMGGRAKRERDQRPGRKAVASSSRLDDEQ